MRKAIAITGLFLFLGLHAAAQFEFGAQLTALDLRNVVGEKPLGLGGRFGYNVTEHLSAESELNYFPQNPSGNFGETQALFGFKAGQRFADVPAFGDFGLFAKARPGLVHFGGPFFAERNPDNRTKLAFDLGVVFERYFKSHGVFRLDFSDVIIPFGSQQINAGAVEPLRPATSHNFQVTIGLGVRF